jgi:hypothetical protein
MVSPCASIPAWGAAPGESVVVTRLLSGDDDMMPQTLVNHVTRVEDPEYGGGAGAIHLRIGYARSEARFGLFSGFFDPEPGDVEGGKEEEGQQGRNEEAADNGVGHRAPEDFRGDRDHAQRGGGCAAAVSTIGRKRLLVIARAVYWRKAGSQWI